MKEDLKAKFKQMKEEKENCYNLKISVNSKQQMLLEQFNNDKINRIIIYKNSLPYLCEIIIDIFDDIKTKTKKEVN